MELQLDLGVGFQIRIGGSGTDTQDRYVEPPRGSVCTPWIMESKKIQVAKEQLKAALNTLDGKSPEPASSSRKHSKCCSTISTCSCVFNI